MNSTAWYLDSRGQIRIEYSRNGERNGVRRERANICAKSTADCHPNGLSGYMARYLVAEHIHSHNFELAIPGSQTFAKLLALPRRTDANAGQWRVVHVLVDCPTLNTGRQQLRNKLGDAINSVSAVLGGCNDQGTEY
jgi:hypothetical protein